MIRAAFPRVTISEYFRVPQKPHLTGPEKKAQPSLWSEVCGASVFSLTDGLLNRLLVGRSVVACLTRWLQLF